ncbi:mitochondrial intermembrane space import and assembly protein 40-B-like [Rhopilema esculentum]|uniref:mitochondrial intermembrane space import and assembly protein 40-B-like n=1 Tax=Rhopilema esculentum TaxID=499914 RepID=UPI0031CF8061
MSRQIQQGKDTIIFLSKEELDEPSQIKLEYEKEDEEHMGLIKPDGEINWNCPCLQGMADGPCGQEFRASFSCFHFSEADPKGSDCIDQFRSMQECFVQHPEVYSMDDDSDKKDIENVENVPVLANNESIETNADKPEIEKEISEELRTESSEDKVDEKVAVTDNLENETIADKS